MWNFPELQIETTYETPCHVFQKFIKLQIETYSMTGIGFHVASVLCTLLTCKSKAASETYTATILHNSTILCSPQSAIYNETISFSSTIASRTHSNFDLHDVWRNIQSQFPETGGDFSCCEWLMKIPFYWSNEKPKSKTVRIFDMWKITWE